MKVRGPLITLGAVAVLAVGILLVNISKETEPTAAKSPTTTAAGAPTQATTPSTPPPAAFPAKADYIGKIPTSNGVITLEITVDGNKAIAYACDGNTVEVWLKGPAENGVLNLENKDKTSRLDGHLQGNSVDGNLQIREMSWDFSAAPAQPPAGLYVYEEGGVRNSWIIGEDNAVTGVQRQPDGSTSPAPGLSPDGTAVINGRTVTATRVEGDSDVI